MALPAPFYQDALVTLFLGDALAILPQIASRSFDFVITDPPARASEFPNDTLVTQVTPDLQRVVKNNNRIFIVQACVPVLDASGNVIAQNVTVNTKAPQLVNDPDLKAGYASTMMTASGVIANTTVLDPFAGAGVWFLRALKQMGIACTGIEINPAFAAIAAARLAAV